MAFNLSETLLINLKYFIGLVTLKYHSLINEIN